MNKNEPQSWLLDNNKQWKLALSYIDYEAFRLEFEKSLKELLSFVEGGGYTFTQIKTPRFK